LAVLFELSVARRRVITSGPFPRIPTNIQKMASWNTWGFHSSDRVGPGSAMPRRRSSPGPAAARRQHLRGARRRAALRQDLYMAHGHVHPGHFHRHDEHFHGAFHGAAGFPELGFHPTHFCWTDSPRPTTLLCRIRERDWGDWPRIREARKLLFCIRLRVWWKLQGGNEGSKQNNEGGKQAGGECWKGSSGRCREPAAVAVGKRNSVCGGTSPHRFGGFRRATD